VKDFFWENFAVLIVKSVNGYIAALQLKHFFANSAMNKDCPEIRECVIVFLSR